MALSKQPLINIAIDLDNLEKKSNPGSKQLNIQQGQLAYSALKEASETNSRPVTFCRKAKDWLPLLTLSTPSVLNGIKQAPQFVTNLLGLKLAPGSHYALTTVGGLISGVLGIYLYRSCGPNDETQEELDRLKNELIVSVTTTNSGMYDATDLLDKAKNINDQICKFKNFIETLTSEQRSKLKFARLVNLNIDISSKYHLSLFSQRNKYCPQFYSFFWSCTSYISGFTNAFAAGAALSTLCSINPLSYNLISLVFGFFGLLRNMLYYKNRLKNHPSSNAVAAAYLNHDESIDHLNHIQQLTNTQNQKIENLRDILDSYISKMNELRYYLDKNIYPELKIQDQIETASILIGDKQNIIRPSVFSGMPQSKLTLTSKTFKDYAVNETPEPNSHLISVIASSGFLLLTTTLQILGSGLGTWSLLLGGLVVASLIYYITRFKHVTPHLVTFNHILDDIVMPSINEREAALRDNYDCIFRDNKIEKGLVKTLEACQRNLSSIQSSIDLKKSNNKERFLSEDSKLTNSATKLTSSNQMHTASNEELEAFRKKFLFNPF